ncbi:MAG: phosphatidate cytidylyltransferase [bacterium]
MIAKIAWGLFLGSIVLYILVWGHFLLFAIAAFAATVALAEFYLLLQQKGFKPIIWAGMMLGWLFLIIGWVDPDYSFQGVVTGGILGVLLVQFVQAQREVVRYSVSDLALTLFGSIYIGGLLSYAFGLKGIYKEYFSDIYASDVIVLLPFAGAWACDAGGYIAGKFLGKNLLCPKISPKKTVEGAVAGVMASIVCTVLLCLLVHIPLRLSIPLGMLNGVFGLCGDLTESAFKREMEVKDTGTLMRYFGGVLDRIDSVIFTIPLTYYYFYLFILSGK